MKKLSLTQVKADFVSYMDQLEMLPASKWVEAKRLWREVILSLVFVYSLLWFGNSFVTTMFNEEVMEVMRYVVLTICVLYAVSVLTVTTVKHIFLLGRYVVRKALH
ncbi:MAG: hypothetical protein U0M61_03545 [Succinivibrio sp.]|nr:hypothetical protein [Succinivibrio sp.]